MYVRLFSDNFYTLFYYFVLYSFVGWCLEVVYALYDDKKFVNRGFLYGPFCPMYGFGALLLIVVLKSSEHNLFLFFILAFVLISVLEYFTGFLLEKVFNTKWWDYSEDFMNIKGRVCLVFSIAWGVGSVIFIKYIHPYFSGKSKFIYTNYGRLFLNLLFIYLIIDFTLTLISIVKLNTILSQIYDVYTEARNKLDNIKENGFEKIDYEAMFKELKGRYEILFKKMQSQYSRLLEAFPFFTSEKVNKIGEGIKTKVKSLTKNKKV